MEMREPLIEEMQDQYDAERQSVKALPGIDRLTTQSAYRPVKEH
jgi:ferritin-like metal-binding protein YciE